MFHRVLSILFCIALLTGCAKYKERFAGQEKGYLQATEGAQLQFPKGVNALPFNSRFDVPKVAGDVGPVNLLPPGFNVNLKEKP